MTQNAAPSFPEAPGTQDADVLREFADGGALHVVNETMLWPLGLTLTVSAKRDDATGEVVWDGATIRLDDLGERIVTGYDPEQHDQTHKDYEAYLEGRRGRVRE